MIACRHNHAPLRRELADQLLVGGVHARNRARGVVVERRHLRQIAGIREQHTTQDARKGRDDEQRDDAGAAGDADDVVGHAQRERPAGRAATEPPLAGVPACAPPAGAVAAPPPAPGPLELLGAGAGAGFAVIGEPASPPPGRSQDARGPCGGGVAAGAADAAGVRGTAGVWRGAIGSMRAGVACTVTVGADVGIGTVLLDVPRQMTTGGGAGSAAAGAAAATACGFAVCVEPAGGWLRAGIGATVPGTAGGALVT